MDKAPTSKSLSEMLIYELAKAIALPNSETAKRFIRRLVGKAAQKFSNLALELDQVISKGGLSAGARWIQPRFVKSNDARGVENIPSEGPLVIASNHPGAYDSVMISAHVERPDYKIIIGNIPFFQNLPNLSKRAIFAPDVDNVVGRMKTVRESIRHLENGGALLIFARGNIETDPSIAPESETEFHLWSRSLEIFLRHVPKARILTTIVSGVIAQVAMNHPVTWLRKTRPDKQRLAFMYQMIRQMITGSELFGLKSKVTFGELVTGKTQEQTLGNIANAAQNTYQKHLAWQV